jgi:hypothetical protein
VAEYEGFNKDDHVIRWLWEIVAAYPPDSQRKFLMFFTGSDRVIPTGSHTMQVKISCAGASLETVCSVILILTIFAFAGPDSERLPVAHTCFVRVADSAGTKISVFLTSGLAESNVALSVFVEAKAGPEAAHGNRRKRGICVEIA